jgi:hypothetical protein
MSRKICYVDVRNNGIKDFVANQYCYEWTGLYDANGVAIAEGHITTKGQVRYDDGCWWVFETLGCGASHRLYRDYITERQVMVTGHKDIPEKLEVGKYYKNADNYKIHVLAELDTDLFNKIQICEFKNVGFGIGKVNEHIIWNEIAKEDF